MGGGGAVSYERGTPEMNDLIDFQDDTAASHAAKMSKDEGKL